MSDLSDLANIIYGEAADQDDKVMKMVGSSVINRQRSGRTEEFGGTIAEIGQKGYYAVKNPNQPYKEALSQKFGNEESELKYKKAVAIAGGLLKETIPPDKGLFYFKADEEKKLRGKPKVFNFKLVTPTAKVGAYQVYDYK